MCWDNLIIPNVTYYSSQFKSQTVKRFGPTHALSFKVIKCYWPSVCTRLGSLFVVYCSKVGATLVRQLCLDDSRCLDHCLDDHIVEHVVLVQEEFIIEFLAAIKETNLTYPHLQITFLNESVFQLLDVRQIWNWDRTVNSWRADFHLITLNLKNAYV